MGFRSNFITEDRRAPLPNWFIEKYPTYSYRTSEDGVKSFGIAQTWESKFYNDLKEDDRFLDIQKVLKEIDLEEIVLILLHECGGITRVHITHNSITGREPTEWKEVENVEHNYCYGCSEKKLSSN